MSAYYRPPEAVGNPPFPFHPSEVIYTGEGSLLSTADRNNSLSGMKIPLEKRGRITGCIPERLAQLTVVRKRTMSAETTDTATSGRRRRRRNQNGVVSSTTADFQVADPPTMTSKTDEGNRWEDWSRDDGSHGAGYHGDIISRGSFITGFGGSPDDAARVGDVWCLHGCSGGIHRGVFDRRNITSDNEYQHHFLKSPQDETDYRDRWNIGTIKRIEDVGGRRVTENPEEEKRKDWTAVSRGYRVTELKLLFDSYGALDLTLPKTSK